MALADAGGRLTGGHRPRPRGAVPAAGLPGPREVTEETGLTGISAIRPIAVDHRPRADTGQPRRTTFFQLMADPDGADAWHHRVRGDGEDAGLLFACRFVPLPPAGRPADAQDAWLNRIDR
ncbi:hypothetical protein ACFOWE_14665 [Planomonospora corallina]|uniref:NUDIX domain-containing protein n=1 Tax=Planomonospora corallina TaxID=1806052 RepID=A0ABV8I931_9ACTN